jgi:hypothetical protein
MSAIPLPPTSTMDTGDAGGPGPTAGMASGATGSTKVRSGAMGADLGGSARAATPTPGVYLTSDLSKITPMRHQGRGLMRVVGNDELVAADKRSRSLAKLDTEVMTDLANYVRDRFEKSVRHRRTVFVDQDLIAAMRAYNGQYDPAKLSEIRKFGGSEVYSRMMTMKCRGATALLRNVYMNSDRPWRIEPTEDPTIPDAIDGMIKRLITAEVQHVNAGGQKVDMDKIRLREKVLYEAAKLNERRKASDEAKEAQRKVDAILEKGGFYKALSEFLIDLPVYKYAVIKGPTTRRHSSLKWVRNGKMERHEEARFEWDRVSPWDIWFSPGATSITNTEVFERQRLSPNDLYNLIGLPGYRDQDIRDIITAYEARGYKEWIQIFDFERAFMEGRNNVLDDTFINAIEFNGYVLGRYLKEYGVPGIEDELKPYFITCWMVDKKIFKVMLNPSPRQRVPYYVTSFDIQPGSLYGNGIPSLANDLTDVINACLRAVVNNISISSGPQVVYNDDMISPTQDDSLYPWKRWRYVGDPSMPNAKPVDFFQPTDNSAAVMQVLDKFSVMLDDVSTIPRYLTGGGANSGAGRTASGLSMLINNANKTLQNVADNIDNNVFEPLIMQLYDFIMLTDSTGMLRGDENIVVDGVRQAAKQEQDLTRQLEFLNIVNNPNYQAMLGPSEMSTILQAIADNLGIEVNVKKTDAIPGGGAPPPQPMPPPPPPPPRVDIQFKGNLPPGATPGNLGGTGGPNPTGNNTPNPNPASAQPGAGGVPGLQPAPQASPVNTVNNRQA